MILGTWIWILVRILYFSKICLKWKENIIFIILKTTKRSYFVATTLFKIFCNLFIRNSWIFNCFVELFSTFCLFSINYDCLERWSNLIFPKWLPKKLLFFLSLCPRWTYFTQVPVVTSFTVWKRRLIYYQESCLTFTVASLTSPQRIH